MLQCFKNKTSGTFTHYEAITTCTERATCMLRVIIACRKSMHGIESAYATLTNSSFGTSRYNYIGLSHTQQIKSISQGMGWRGTSTCCNIVWTVETIKHANLSGCNVGYHLRDEIRIEFRTFFCMLSIIHYFILKCFNAANTYTVYNSYTVFVFAFQVQTWVVYTLYGADKCQLCTTIHLAGIFTIDVFVNIKVLYLTTKLRLKIGCVKMCKRSCTALTLQKALPGFFCSVAQGCNSTYSCYNNSI